MTNYETSMTTFLKTFVLYYHTGKKKVEFLENTSRSLFGYVRPNPSSFFEFTKFLSNSSLSLRIEQGSLQQF